MLSFESGPQCREHVFLFQLTLTINITPINITLCILAKDESYKAEVDPNFVYYGPKHF